jgi:hypothetical protein
MKRFIIPVAFTLVACAVALGQAKRNSSIEAELIAIEKRGFEAWKKRDKQYFLDTTTESSQNIISSGVMNRELWAFLSSSPHCTPKSFEMDNTKLIMLNPETALLIFRSTQDVVCSGKQAPSQNWVSTIYVKRGEKWLTAFHQETPAQAN